MIRTASILAVIGALMLSAGCRRAPRPIIVDAEGFVMLDGKPVNKASVRFIPSMAVGPEYTAMGVTDEMGHFFLTCKGRSGAVAGENRVIIREAELPDHLKGEDKGVQIGEYLSLLGGRPLPRQYGSMVNTPLTIEVSAAQKEYTLEMIRQPDQPK